MILGVVSLTMGNSGFPAGDCPAGNRQLFGQLLLCQSLFLTERLKKRSDPDLIHAGASFRPEYSAGWVRLTRHKARNAMVLGDSSVRYGNDGLSSLVLFYHVC